MLYWMNSKTFKDEFLQLESYKDILNSQYVLVSTRIRSGGKYQNVISANNIIYPNPSVFIAMDDDIFRERYLEQLESCKPFLATLIKGSIEEDFNIIFMCSKKENKINYLQILADFVFLEFGYPMYEYRLYCIGACKLYKYDKYKILKKCNKILDKAKIHEIEKASRKASHIEEIEKRLKELSKDELKKELKSRSLYKKGMSKSDMIEMLSAFI